jgi:tetratricopeptide (TPR) repeat protein
MVLVPHKYLVESMPVEELRRTFAARTHTLKYLLDELRGQAASRTLKSYFIYGPRGSGKTTVVRMLCLSINEDPTLRAAWLPVVLPEEVHGVASLRDLLAAILRTLSEAGAACAPEWHQRVEAERDDRASRDLAIQAVREIARQESRRLIVIVENLDNVFRRAPERGLDRQERATLRRLLMENDPCLMLVGTGVRMFPELERYDEALFQYFLPVRLERLDDEQVRDILFCRAEFDGNAHFATQYHANLESIKPLTRLTGGNPRLILYLYEIITVGNIASVVEALRSLVDSLTPLFKDIIEHQMTRQQAKVMDALMRAGGTAKPSDLVKPTRLTLNAVTSQLVRLRETQVLEVHGGGKGRAAYYSVPDQIFCTWYQIRYLRPHQRRIEFFIEFLRLWFAEETRRDMLRRLVSGKEQPLGLKKFDEPLAAEYIAATLKDTPYEREARDLALRGWLAKGRLDEAAFALAEFEGLGAGGRLQYEAGAYRGLGMWALQGGDLQTAIRTLNEAVDREPTNTDAVFSLGLAFGSSGDHERAGSCFDRALASPGISVQLRSQALHNRGVSRARRGDAEGAIADYSAVIELPGAPVEVVALALYNRGVSRAQREDTEGAIADCSTVIELPGAPAEVVTQALLTRGVSRAQREDTEGAIADWSTVIELPGAPSKVVTQALLLRGISRAQRGDAEGELADYSAVIELPGAPTEVVAKALVNRGISRLRRGDPRGAIADYSAVIELPGAPAELVAKALFNRGASRLQLGDSEGAIADFSAVVELPGTPIDQVAEALFIRGMSRALLGDREGELADYSAVIDLPGATGEVVALARYHRGSDKAARRHLDEALEDLRAAAIIPEAEDGVRNSAVTETLSTANALGRLDEEMLAFARAALDAVEGERRIRGIAAVLGALASPEMRGSWPQIYRALLQGQPPDVGDKLRPLLPVCEVLETGDLSRLDPLAPAERAFAQELIADFSEMEAPSA